MVKPIYFSDLVIQISGDFLTKNLPVGYDGMDEEEVLKFIKEHAWEIYEDCEPSYVFEHIDSSACSLKGFLEGKGIKVTE